MQFHKGVLPGTNGPCNKKVLSNIRQDVFDAGDFIKIFNGRRCVHQNHACSRKTLDNARPTFRKPVFLNMSLILTERTI